MSGFGTKKVGSDFGLQLTFPSVFSEEYEAIGAKPSYAGGLPATARFSYVGDDLQSEYHEQKRADANRMANAKVASTLNHNLRANNSHNGYYGLPKAVLGQRKVAPPLGGLQSYGNDVYGRVREEMDGVRGGVLRTAQGQRYAREILNRRAEWYDAMDKAMEGAPVEPPSDTPLTGRIESGEEVELNLLLDNLIGAVISGSVDRLTADAMLRMMRLLFRYVPTITDRYEFGKVKEKIDTIAKAMRDLLNDRIDDYTAKIDAEDPTQNEVLRSMVYIKIMDGLLERLAEYMDWMYASIDMMDKERLSRSKTAIRKFGITDVSSDLEGMIASRETELAGRGGSKTSTDLEGGRKSRVRKGVMSPDDEWLEALKGREAQTTMTMRSFGRKSGRFTTIPLPREEEERLAEGQSRGDGRDMFDRDTRNEFGEQAGEYYSSYAEAQSGGSLPKDRLRLIRKNI